MGFSAWTGGTRQTHFWALLDPPWGGTPGTPKVPYPGPPGTPLPFRDPPGTPLVPDPSFGVPPPTPKVGVVLRPPYPPTLVRDPPTLGVPWGYPGGSWGYPGGTLGVPYPGPPLPWSGTPPTLVRDPPTLGDPGGYPGVPWGVLGGTPLPWDPPGGVPHLCRELTTIDPPTLGGFPKAGAWVLGSGPPWGPS